MPVEVRIERLAASAALVVAMAGQRVTMAPDAQIMLHEASARVTGTAADLGAVIKRLAKVNDDTAAIFATRTGLPIGLIRRMMACETWLPAERAVLYGFADATHAWGGNIRRFRLMTAPG